MGAAEGQPPLDLLQLESKLPDRRRFMAALAAWEARVNQLLGRAFLRRQRLLEHEEYLDLRSAEDEDYWFWGEEDMPLHKYMTGIFTSCLPPRFSGTESSRIRSLPSFGSPDWL